MENQIFSSSDRRVMAGLRRLGTLGVVFVLTGCVSDTSTSALTSSDIQAKETSHQQRFVSTKCNSNARLSASNRASEALNAKFAAYNQVEASLAPDRKQQLLGQLESQGTQLQTLDANLNSQCISYSACEFQASTNKQSCSRQKRSFLDAEKHMAKLTKTIERLAIN